MYTQPLTQLTGRCLWAELKADVCQRTFSSELANSTCAFSCCTALNAGAGLARPLAEAANCAGTGGAVSRHSAHVCCLYGGIWVRIHARYVSRSSVWWIVAELQKRRWENTQRSVWGLFSCLCRSSAGEPSQEWSDWLQLRHGGYPTWQGKMNYGHYWRCFSMANYHPWRSGNWCINPARCCKCHFTIHWARTAPKQTDNWLNVIPLWRFYVASAVFSYRQAVRKRFWRKEEDAVFSVFLCAKRATGFKSVQSSSGEVSPLLV